MSMQFKANHLFHVFNRGNNRDVIFYNDLNYDFFINKIKEYIVPYADILAWCLMPDHFHLMVEVGKEKIDNRSLNDSIGIMLRSYARAINNQEHRVGSLFQTGTKAINLTAPDEPFLANRNYFYGSSFYYYLHKSLYPLKCMEYIHNNPVKAGFVETPSDYMNSSYNEYLGNGKYNICNKRSGRRFLSLTQ